MFSFSGSFPSYVDYWSDLLNQSKVSCDDISPVCCREFSLQGVYCQDTYMCMIDMIESTVGTFDSWVRQTKAETLASDNSSQLESTYLSINT